MPTYRLVLLDVTCLVAVVCLLGWPHSSALGDYSLAFSTYIGGSELDQIRDVATDSQGNIYVTGGTASPDFPTTAGAYDRTFASGGTKLGSFGPMDVLVIKLSPTGQLIWSTYIGGPNYDRAYAVAVDDTGHVYVAGRAGDGFPTTPGAFQPRFGGGPPGGGYGEQDGFVAKLTPDGSQLVWASYIGTSDETIVRDMALDAAGDVYLGVAYRSAAYSPAVASAFVNDPSGGEDNAVVKVSADGSRVLWGRYFGGSGDEGAPALAVTPTGDAYLASGTKSPDLPTTPGVYDRTYNGKVDGFAARLSKDGASVVYATYLGGSEDDSPSRPHGITLDEQGNAYLSGYTRSADFPTTPGAFRTAHAGGTDGFVAKLSADGTRLLAATFLRGTGEGIAVDRDGNISVPGGANSAGWPVTRDAFASDLKGPQDARLAKLAADFGSLLFATYMGGGRAERYAESFRGIAIDADNAIVAGGVSAGDDWPLLNAFQASHRGDWDCVVVKFAP